MPKFIVYHKKQPTFIDGLLANNSVVRPVNRDDYIQVAVVECGSYEDVFRLTNHIDFDWWKNKQVKWHVKTRSTSVGDVVQMIFSVPASIPLEDPKPMIVNSIGFEIAQWE